jgi:hypothetical protein
VSIGSNLVVVRLLGTTIHIVDLDRLRCLRVALTNQAALEHLQIQSVPKLLPFLFMIDEMFGQTLTLQPTVPPSSMELPMTGALPSF